MKSLAGAAVVFSGVLLSASGVFSAALVSIYHGNRGWNDAAFWGGILIVLVGVFIIFRRCDHHAQ
jgi:hypothetical protein